MLCGAYSIVRLLGLEYVGIISMFGSRTSDLLVIFGIHCLIFSCLLFRKWFTMPIWRIFIRNIPLYRRWKNGRWKHCLFCGFYKYVKLRSLSALMGYKLTNPELTDLLGSLQHFNERYIKSESEHQRAHLKKLIAPFILRRTKNKVLDPWWNPAIEDQASDRAHRMGQRRPVTIYRMVAKNTIEEKIVQLHATKRDMADAMLEGTDQSARLSTADLLALLREV